ncbi:MAG: substrate-binding domain-containing protein [Clostridia bacterium]|nr:substrate-binding domain-containing protein [Clostridia bacterium]
MTKKILSVCMAIALASVSGCTSGTKDPAGTTEPGGNKASGSFDSGSEITVVSREDGSGTRGAFIELFGIEEKGADGTKKDNTTKDAIIANKTDVMMTNVSGDEYAIGYISLGSLSDKVKALKIDGVEASPQNVKNGTYKVARPFNIATKAEVSPVAKDFISFILSSEGQEVVSKSYISVNDNAPAFTSSMESGKIVVAGSTSVTPVMEKLKEAYLKINTNAQIEIQTSDSTAGMTNAMEGTCDIGMASRELKDSEAAVLTAEAIALDGIAVIVNNDNPTDEITSEAVKAVFTGKTTSWSDVK